MITAEVAGTYTGTIATANSSDTNTLDLTATANISGATIDSNFANLTIADGATATMTSAQYSSFDGTITASGTNTVAFSGATTGKTANSVIEKYTFDDATNSFTAHANTTHLTGGTGADTFIMGTNMSSLVTIDGGNGSDEITMTDGGGSTTDLNNVTNVESITLGEAATSITTVDGLVANGETLTVNGSGIGSNAFIFDGSSEADGAFTITDGDFVPKPSIEPYKKIIKKFNLDPKKSILIEDIAHNLKQAKFLGMKTVWLENNEAFASKDKDKPYIDYKIKNLPSFLHEINILKVA